MTAVDYEMNFFHHPADSSQLLHADKKNFILPLDVRRRPRPRRPGAPLPPDQVPLCPARLHLLLRTHQPQGDIPRTLGLPPLGGEGSGAQVDKGQGGRGTEREERGVSRRRALLGHVFLPVLSEAVGGAGIGVGVGVVLVGLFRVGRVRGHADKLRKGREPHAGKG